MATATPAAKSAPAVPKLQDRYQREIVPVPVPGDHVVFVCGNDDAAKAEARALIGEIGWPDEQIIDLGDITGARGTEHYLMLWVRLMGAVGGPQFNIAVNR